MPRLSKIGAAALAAFGWTSGGASTAVTANYLVVAGGGGGGNNFGNANSRGMGGGGAGGYKTSTTSLSLSTSYTVTVGAGGAGGIGIAFPSIGTQPTNGSSSVFNAITSTGGGSGATSNQVAASGGSGGGGCADTNATGGAASPSGQGNAGGNSTDAANTGGGGGGGASGAGGAVGSGTGTGGAGGTGTALSISGSSITYSTGGTGGASSGAASGSAGTANLGNGGVGAAGFSSGTPPSGGNGGSGVVIISYPSPQQFGGGVVTVSGANTIHTFTTSGTLSPLSTLSASYLIVAGGGGGASNGAGGGAGGLLSGSGLTIDTNSTYLISVGSGGSGGVSNNVGTSGGNSTFSMVSTTAVGGGYGGSGGGTVGVSGGSGGGASAGFSGYAGTSGQGNAGGDGGASAIPYAGGGGGGAGAVGGNGNNGTSTAGSGGVGVSSSISGTATYYAGGGGGSGYSVATGGAGGNGGGGAGGSYTQAGTSGTSFTGGGGGAGGYNGGAPLGGGSGGSGIVIISYAGATQLMAGGTVTISGGNVIHTFTSSGYLTPLTNFNNSLRFRNSASAYLSRTPTVTGSLTKFTFSAWVKRGRLDIDGYLFSAVNSAQTDAIRFNSDGTFGMFYAGSGTVYVKTSSVYRDPAAWYHFVVSIDSTQATASERVKLYANGSLITALAITNYPAQNATFPAWNQAGKLQTIGNDAQLALYADQYMSNINFIDGQALTPNAFGTFNQYGVWQPIYYGGSYGTNGFYLPFNSNTTSAYTGVFSGTNYITSNYNFNWSSGGNFTMEAWVNASSFSSTVNMIGGTTTAQNDGFSLLYYYTSGAIAFGINGTNEFISATGLIKSGNWYHVALVNNGGTLTIYLNGRAVAVTTSGSTYLSNNSAAMRMGGNTTSTQGIIGNMSNFRFVTSAVYTSNFTPPTTNLTAIANTQLLTFQNSSIVDNSGNSRTLTNTGSVTTNVQYPNNLTVFNDKGPAGNNWTPNNISLALGSTYDSMTDVPTLTSTTAANYCVFNPVNVSGGGSTIYDGNLGATTGSSGTYGKVLGSLGMVSGKWYWETKITSIGSGGNVGLGDGSPPSGSFGLGGYPGELSYTSSGNKYTNAVSTSYGASYTTGDVIGAAYDADAGSITFYKNNVSQGAITGLSGTKFAAVGSSGGTSPQYTVNFGQQPYIYTPPSGFLPLNTFNL